MYGLKPQRYNKKVLPPKFKTSKAIGKTLRKLSIQSEEGESSKRAKERRIDYVIEKVKTWRRLFKGVPDKDTGDLVRYTLEEAAHMVGLSKKSLDDYLL